MFNKVILVGRISTNLELRQTSNMKSYCRFNIAVNKIGQEGTNFIPVTVWSKQAENLVQYQDKGSLILVEGSINMSNYTDADGNNRTSFDVMAQNIQYLNSKKSENETISENSTDEVDPYDEMEEQVNIDDDFLE